MSLPWVWLLLVGVARSRAVLMGRGASTGGLPRGLCGVCTGGNFTSRCLRRRFKFGCFRLSFRRLHIINVWYRLVAIVISYCLWYFICTTTVIVATALVVVASLHHLTATRTWCVTTAACATVALWLWTWEKINWLEHGRKWYGMKNRRKPEWGKTQNVTMLEPRIMFSGSTYNLGENYSKFKSFENPN